MKALLRLHGSAMSLPRMTILTTILKSYMKTRTLLSVKVLTEAIWMIFMEIKVTTTFLITPSTETQQLGTLFHHKAIITTWLPVRTRVKSCKSIIWTLRLTRTSEVCSKPSINILRIAPRIAMMKTTKGILGTIPSTWANLNASSLISRIRAKPSTLMTSPSVVADRRLSKSF